MEKQYKSVDEFLEDKRKELENPERYNVVGDYKCHGKQNHFTGTFEIGTNGKLAGDIVDPNSVCKRHAVKGEIAIKDIVYLYFVKIPDNPLSLVPIYYYLSKYGGKDIEGTYTGEWRFEEKALKFDLTPETETLNSAMINLSKI